MVENVLIVGAGPTGLTAAVELARQDIDVKIIDRREGGSGLSRAVGIMPVSLELLEASGATDRLIAEGVRFKSVKIYDKSKLILPLRLSPSKVQHGRDFILGLAQDRTEAILRDVLGEFGIAVDYTTELIDLSQDDVGVTAAYSDGSSSHHSYVIGADGVRSTTRDLLGIEFPGIELDETWSIADVDATGWENAEAFTVCLLESGAVVVVAPLEAERFRVIANCPDALRQLPIPMKVTNIRREGEFAISVRQVETYQKDRVFLAGDAAHCHSPVGGRGMNLGIADAAEIAQRIVVGDTLGYSASRHKEGAAIIAGSERARRAITSSSQMIRTVAGLTIKAASVLPPLERRMATEFLYG